MCMHNINNYNITTWYGEIIICKVYIILFQMLRRNNDTCLVKRIIDHSVHQNIILAVMHTYLYVLDVFRL
jgi:hypothetical protein